uniref:Uncharacterized protein n=1 Tax=Candidatus Kentrum eta TaxID=2126337 RepID=A0A450UB20_9GAMM|nr:MAG: hypothetical protein BECKH772A_GA0070896_1000425 [Candidatus Kentron sp. H]VFJ89374.1 MAG: hypothetical protein BECKH772B_GA0070898_1000425 [Candidatus Kentron sp. H]VFJ95954.1 MAG: hypothetical protein BECKH772C_GA0070978_1000426 [Candidatus Kentron sp. H]
MKQLTHNGTHSLNLFEMALFNQVLVIGPNIVLVVAGIGIWYGERSAMRADIEAIVQTTIAAQERQSGEADITPPPPTTGSGSSMNSPRPFGYCGRLVSTRNNARRWSSNFSRASHTGPMPS